jgi:precorrin-3B methylase
MTFQEAQRKAKYGRYPVVGYGPKDSRTYERMTRDSLKRALLATGTQGYFTMLEPNTGIGNIVRWRLGTQLLRNIKYLLAA